jgi:hypothetical protein
MAKSVRLSRCWAVAAVLALCVLVPACGKKPKLTLANYEKIYDGMTLKDAQSILGKGEELTPGAKERPSGSSVGAAAGIDMPAPAPEPGPTLLPRIYFSAGATVMQWEEGQRVVQMVFVNDKMKVKEKKGF